MDSYFADLHIHSCLSPCADDDMTPADLVGMAALKGLQMVAVTDHNAAGNLPAAQAAADFYGLLLIPGMEITTREEVHMLGYFPDVPTAMAFGEFVRAHLPAKKNRPDFFGNQLITDEDGNPVAEEDALLIGATDLPLSQLAEEVRRVGGVPVPAHINRGSNGLLVNLGFMPESCRFTAVEVWRHLPCAHSPQQGRVILHSSDAHHLGDILEPEFSLSLPEPSVAAFLDHLRRGAQGAS